jgi:hypothetical protein
VELRKFGCVSALYDSNCFGLLKYTTEPAQVQVLWDVLYGQIVYGFYTLNSFGHKSDDIRTFIEYGFARTRSGKDVIDEPLAIMAAWKWFDERDHFSLLNCLQRGVGNNSPRKNRLEAYLAFYMRKVFEGPARLSDVFTFRSDFALRNELDLSWQSEEFELVTVSIPAGTDERKISVVTPLCGPSPNVGFTADTDNDVLEWITENKECYAFCFPTLSAGPDIFFYVRSKPTRRLLLVALQAKNYNDHIDKSTLLHGVRSVTPSFFWKSKDKKKKVRVT